MSTPRARRRWVLPTITALVACLAALTVGVVGGRSIAAAEDRIEVGVSVGQPGEEPAQLDAIQRFEVGPDQTVTSVLINAGVIPRPGRLLSVKTHKVLDPDLHPARVLVDGQPAEDSTPVPDGAVVQVIHGQDQVEDTVSARETVPPLAFPPVLRHVHVRGRTGVSEITRGKDSGEIAGTRVISQPTAPTQTTDRVVALTIDDGPNPDWTPVALAILKEKGVKATFCQVGTFLRRHPELAKQIVAEGHELCNHSLDHDEHLDRADAAHLEEEVQGPNDIYEQSGIARPTYFRAPGGNVNDAVVASANGKGMVVLGWKVDTEDWRTGATPEKIVDTAMAQVDDGAIILIHDGGGKTRAPTMAALGPMIDRLREAGYSFVFPVTG